MKIAITGHSAGIGAALAEAYYGNEIVGLSRRNGFNIRSVPKCADEIESCDMWINNAQVGFAQTELLFEVWRRWQNTNKTIMVISTEMTAMPASPRPEWDEYWQQKRTLEEATKQLANKPGSPRLILVKPGSVATQPDQTVPPYADPDQWARTLVGLLRMAESNGLTIHEIALGPNAINT
jgi:hypothetical protein